MPTAREIAILIRIFNYRPANVGRNTGLGYDFSSLDLRLSRNFQFTERVRLEAMIEGFNILNRANFHRRTTFLEQVRYHRQPLDNRPRRQIQGKFSLACA
jgi:hypothetical protein